MRPEHEHIITSYLNNEMDDAQREAFEDSCRKDPALLADLKNEVKVRLAVNDYARKQRRAFYENNRTEETPSKKNVSITPNTYLKIAASVVVVFSISYLVYILSLAPQPADIFADNFQPYVLSSARDQPATPVNALDSLRQDATLAYGHQEWERSRTLFAELLSQQEYIPTDLDRLLMANIALAQDSAGVALEALNKIDTGNTAIKYDRAWYRALAYLKLGDKEPALKELGMLADSREYKERAREIMDQIK